MSKRIHAIQFKAVTVKFAEDGDFIEQPHMAHGYRVAVAMHSAEEIHAAAQKAARELADAIIKEAGL